MKRLVSFFCAMAFVCAAASAQSEALPVQSDGHDGEFRGAWLATVAGLDWPSCDEAPIVQQLHLIEAIKGLSEAGCNTLIFQVISNMDALYPSKYLPWSAVLTGEEGKQPWYNPLDLAIKVAHECGMQIHAWINPLRVCRSDDQPHAPGHVTNTHPEWVQNYHHKLFLDPGNPEVVEFLGKIADEIVSGYDVDGLHIDDYFYPDGLQSDEGQTEWNDSLYVKYGNGLSLHEWRYANINNVVRELFEATHRAKPNVVFGVSPAGRLSNTRHLYADPERWVNEGTVDYLAPQIYWAIGRGDAAAFETVLDSWRFVAKGVPVYVGIAAYKHNDAYYRGKDLPYMSMSEFKRELEMCRETWYVKGHIWFRTKNILEDEFKAYILSELY